MVSLCGPEFDSPQVHQMRGLQVVNSDLQPSLLYPNRSLEPELIVVDCPSRLAVVFLQA